ncbi:MAG TPA: polysaccharide biosynthesis tyrosine autokinase [Bacteroidales bacterium]|nr:polysaccharide biosynthesis tyrosine autokinase [Bacteroidales bacterium]
MNFNQSPNQYSQSAYYNAIGDTTLDIKRYLSMFISNWYWFAITLFITLSIAYGINRWSEEVFTVKSTLLINDDQLGGYSPGAQNIFPGAEVYRNQQNLRNEIGILKSYKLNYAVMKELPDFYIEYIMVGKRGFAESRLYNKSPFIVKYDSLKLQKQGGRIYIKILSETQYEISINGDLDFKKVMMFGDRFNEMGYDFIILPRPGFIKVYDSRLSNRYYFYFNDPATLANRYRNKLSVTPVDEQASLVTLSVSGFVAEQESDYLNKLMDEYLDYGLNLKNETAINTMSFIEEQLAIISDSLKLAEEDLENFRYFNNLIDISQEGATIRTKLEQIDAERTNLLLQKNYYEYLKEYLSSKRESGDIVAPSVMGISDQLLIRLVNELSALQQQKKQLAMNLYESAEPLKIIEANIITTKNAISENIVNGLSTIENSIKDADLRLEELDKEIKKLPSTERQMINFQREYDINNTVYTYLLEKRAEAGIAKASNVSDNQIIDYAGPYNISRIKPRIRQNYLMALVLGLMIPIGLIIIIDYLNNKIIDKKDIQKETNVPVIGYVGHNSLKTEIPVKEQSGSALAESFRSVRTNLKYFLKEVSNPVIAVSSTITSEGKTFVSANLAAIIAALGKKVLLIGLDLRKPRTHKILGIDNSDGLSRYLIGESRIEDIMIETNIENLWYTPSGPVPPNPAELIDSDEMKDFIIKARKIFDYIIIDTPPVAVVTDALLVSSLADFYLFVVRQRYTSKNTLALINELHINQSLKSMGIVINDISVSGYYGYGLRYGYALGYGYSYGYNYYGDYINYKYGVYDSGKDYYRNES